jgi:hypothetical protein
MTDWGFIIKRVTLTGPSVEKAEVELAAGLNIIVGPSDTGKTFMVQCIDYAFGAGTVPKEIPEAEKYDLISVAIRGNADGREYILERSLRGGEVRLTSEGASRDLLAKHDGEREDTVSHFLLTQSGFPGRKVRTNKSGATRGLSFRDIAHLTIVDETAIMAERSPALSGQYTGKTVEASVFRLFLTGVDDSTVVATEAPKVVKSKRDAKIEVLDELIKRTQEQIQQLGVTDTRDEVLDTLTKIEAFFTELSRELSIEQASIAALEEQRRAAWGTLRHSESRLDVVRELRKRFELLRHQYTSDLRRLETIAEAGGRLAQMTEERCPVCGSAAEHHDKTHQREHSSPQDVAAASRAEANKIQALLTDLGKTLTDNAAEGVRLVAERDRLRKEIDTIAASLRANLEPRMQAVLARFQESQAQRDKLRAAADHFERLDELMQLRSTAQASKASQPTELPVSDVSASAVEMFSQEIEALLRAWSFPNLTRVTYSEEDLDVVISGRRRSSHGKGVRAVTHAAFTLALLRHCMARDMPHPGVVIIDSPLVVYRKPDPDEKGFAPEVKDAFYRSVASSFTNSQVIIFENDDPPSDVASAAKVVKFTSSSQGRYGFIPL